ncbi:hypothetical protein BDQ17DRAFT_1501833 [Cyathus striatus]|nr:hypothetical protein BDQ17DRAFT_1501833 [Cyathus striatus]
MVRSPLSIQSPSTLAMHRIAFHVVFININAFQQYVLEIMRAEVSDSSMKAGITFGSVTVCIKLQSLKKAEMQTQDESNPVQTAGSMPLHHVKTNITEEVEDDSENSRRTPESSITAVLRLGAWARTTQKIQKHYVFNYNLGRTLKIIHYITALAFEFWPNITLPVPLFDPPEDA